MLLYLIRRLASYYLQKSVPICSQDKEGSRAYLPDDKKTSDDFKEVQAAVVKVRSTWGALTSPLALTPIVKEGGFRGSNNFLEFSPSSTVSVLIV